MRLALPPHKYKAFELPLSPAADSERKRGIKRMLCREILLAHEDALLLVEQGAMMWDAKHRLVRVPGAVIKNRRRDASYVLRTSEAATLEQFWDRERLQNRLDFCCLALDADYLLRGLREQRHINPALFDGAEGKEG
jgi:hypothetical protein